MENLAKDLNNSLVEATPLSFLDMPLELRRKVYRYYIDPDPYHHFTWLEAIGGGM